MNAGIRRNLTAAREFFSATQVKGLVGSADFQTLKDATSPITGRTVRDVVVPRVAHWPAAVSELDQFGLRATSDAFGVRATEAEEDVHLVFCLKALWPFGEPLPRNVQPLQHTSRYLTL